MEQISTGGAYFFYTYKVFTIHKYHQICSEKILQILNAINIMEPKFFCWICDVVLMYLIISKIRFQQFLKKDFLPMLNGFHG